MSKPAKRTATPITRRVRDSINPNGPSYCVPFAIAEATGLSYTVVEDLIREKRGQEPGTKVAGVNQRVWFEVVKDLFPEAKLVTAERRQWTANFSDHDEFCDLGPTLARWHRELPADMHERTKMVRMNGHVILVRGDEYCDTEYSNHEWRHLDSHPKRRQRVDFFLVLPIND